MIKTEYNYLNDTETNILLSLNNLIDEYKKEFSRIKIGIAEQEPESVLKKTEGKGVKWEKLVVLFKIKTLYMLNIIEFWLIDEHWDIYIDKYISEEFDITFKKEKYLYILVS